MKHGNKKRGFLFSAIGGQYIQESLYSARRLKELHGEGVGIALFTDQGDVEGPFTEVVQFSSPTEDRTDKIKAILSSPYERTIFLDTDTYAVEALDDVFDLLDNFDMAAAHTKGRIPPNKPDNYVPQGIPVAFPAYNTGVIAYKRNENTKNLFRKWLNIYTHHSKNKDIPERYLPFKDQTPFREALFCTKNIRLSTLPPEYNFRTNTPGYAGVKVKLIHGRSHSFEDAAKSLNLTDRRRVYLSASVPEFVFGKSMGIINKIIYFVKMIYSHFALTMRNGKD